MPVVSACPAFQVRRRCALSLERSFFPPRAYTSLITLDPDRKPTSSQADTAPLHFVPTSYRKPTPPLIGIEHHGQLSDSIVRLV